jgi:hemin uptake protein HemP
MSSNTAASAPRHAGAAADVAATGSALEHASARPPASAGPAPRRYESLALLGAAREAHVLHAGQIYRLRQTLSGKLILTK